MKRGQSDDFKSSVNKRVHAASVFENTDLVAIILNHFVTEDGRDLVKLRHVSTVFNKCITSPRYDEFIWKSYCIAADQFVIKNSNKERFWFLEWKTRVLRKYSFGYFVASHRELQQSPQFQTWQNDPKKYFCFLLRAIPTFTGERPVIDFSHDVIKMLDDQFAVGESKLGGFPESDLPKEVEWPREVVRDNKLLLYNNQMRFGSTLNFKAQINLEQVKFYDRYNILPKEGMLFFFHKRGGCVKSVQYYSKEEISALGGLERRTSLPDNREIDGFFPWKLQFGEGVAVSEWKKATIGNFRLDEIAREFDQSINDQTVDPENEEQEESQETVYIQFLGPNSLAYNARVEFEDEPILPTGRGRGAKGLGGSTSKQEKVCLLELRDEAIGCTPDTLCLWIMLKGDLERHNFTRVTACHWED